MSVFDQLRDSVMTFSYKSILKTNIISNGEITRGGLLSNDVSRSNPANRQIKSYDTRVPLSNFYLSLQMQKQFEYTSLSSRILTIYKSYLIPYLTRSSNIISISNKVPGYKEISERLNRELNNLDIVSEIEGNIEKYFFYGSHSFKVNWNEEERHFEKLNLANPNYVIRLANPDRYLVTSRNGQIYEVNPESICFFGCNNIQLVNDLEGTQGDAVADSKEDTLVAEDGCFGSYPLYFYNTSEVKEFLLKEQILSLLSIKELIRPLIFLLRTQNSTSPDEANKLALYIEKMINKYTDMTSIMGNNFSINELMDSLLNNLRVVPDYSGAMADLNELNLEKINEKISDLRSNQDTSRESLLVDFGIPISLYRGESTKWDAIRNNQRLQGLISNFIKGIDRGIINLSYNLIKVLFRDAVITKDDITSNIFGKTEVDLAITSSNADVIGNLVDQITRIADNGVKAVGDIKIIDKKKYLQFIRSKIVSLDSDFEDIITDKTIEEFIKNSEKEQQDSYQ